MPLTFEDPPVTSTGPKPDVLPLADVDALIAHTGKWARVADAKTRATMTNRAKRIRDGAGNCAGHTWETAVRKVGDVHVLYVRHIAPAQEK
jgi:hypothetical protein